MTKLLVSVRDVEEARIALEAGVDLIDLKEPSHGALGAVDTKVAEEVVRLRDSGNEAQRTIPLSMALGELVDYFPDDAVPDESARPASLPTIPVGIRYAKVGLAGCAPRKYWRAQLRWFVRNVVQARGFVAVVYADGDLVQAPSAEDVLEAAIELGARALLVDTAVKDGRGLFDHWAADQLKRFMRAPKLLTVVGGGLTLESIPTAAAYRPSYVAVRGAACRGVRTSKIDAERIQEIFDALATVPKPQLRTSTQRQS